jgi:hypothetical protein
VSGADDVVIVVAAGAVTGAAAVSVDPGAATLVGRRGHGPTPARGSGVPPYVLPTGSAAPQRRHAIQLAGTSVRQLGHRFTARSGTPQPVSAEGVSSL